MILPDATTNLISFNCNRALNMALLLCSSLLGIIEGVGEGIRGLRRDLIKKIKFENAVSLEPLYLHLPNYFLN